MLSRDTVGNAARWRPNEPCRGATGKVPLLRGKINIPVSRLHETHAVAGRSCLPEQVLKAKRTAPDEEPQEKHCTTDRRCLRGKERERVPHRLEHGVRMRRMRPSGGHVPGPQNPIPLLTHCHPQTINPVLQSSLPAACLHGSHSRRPRTDDPPNAATLTDGVTTANRTRANHFLCFPLPAPNCPQRRDGASGTPCLTLRQGPS